MRLGGLRPRAPKYECNVDMNDTEEMKDTQLVTRPAFGLQTFTAQDMVDRVRLIQSVMATVMKPGVHYGKVSGCGDKPSLLKPGAEILCNTFMLAAEYDKETTELPDGHKLYDIRCKLTHIPTGVFVGSCLAVATTMEGKWRFRSELIRDADGEPLKVPREYWKSRNSDLIGGSEFQTKKVDGDWVIVHRVEHDNPADYYNTATKIGCKRGLVGAIMNVTGVSDVFTQDVEDMPEVFGEEENHPRGERVNRQEPKAQGTVDPKESLYQGVLEKAYSTDARKDDKDQRKWYNGFINGRKLWTRKADVGEDLLAAKGTEVVVRIRSGTKPNVYQVMEVQVPDNPSIAKQEQEPDEIPGLIP